ncbi:MAG: S49 family peptidase [Chlamydiia bacterium]|nr:S49 family peptidase [Chlamydiia bacterium]
MSNTESLWRSSARSFLTSFFKVLGFIFALLPILLLIGGAVNYEEDKPESEFNINVVSNHEGKRERLKSKATILEMDISGFIGGEGLNKGKISQMLVESREGDLKNDLVKGVLLNINTPGGSAIDSDTIYRLVKMYKEKYNVPVYAFVDGMCASGGMYIACSADKVMATPTSIIGSVGVVIGPFFNFSEPLAKWGIQSQTLTAGNNKDPFNPFRPWKENEGSNLKLVMENFYQEFIDVVSANRPELTIEKLKSDFGAGIYPTSMALKYGYIDQTVTSRDEALLQLVEAAELDPNDYQVVKLEKENFLANLFKADAKILQGKVEHRISLGSELPRELHGQVLYLFQP